MIYSDEPQPADELLSCPARHGLERNRNALLQEKKRKKNMEKKHQVKDKRQRVERSRVSHSFTSICTQGESISTADLKILGFDEPSNHEQIENVS